MNFDEFIKELKNKCVVYHKSDIGKLLYEIDKLVEEYKAKGGN